jgi:hypothetical protein
MQTRGRSTQVPAQKPQSQSASTAQGLATQPLAEVAGWQTWFVGQATSVHETATHPRKAVAVVQR